MKKILFATIVALISSLAMAASVHFKQNRTPTFVDSGLFLQSGGSLVGLGNGDVVITLSAQADVISTCTNPSGQNQPPGQNPAALTLTGSQIIPDDEIKNGTLSFTVRTASPDPVVAGAPGCPNSHWTQRIEDLKFTAAVLTVEQPAGVVALRLACTFAAPTVNGTEPPSMVTCTIQ
jgi:hypothetical protein